MATAGTRPVEKAHTQAGQHMTTRDPKRPKRIHGVPTLNDGRYSLIRIPGPKPFAIYDEMLKGLCRMPGNPEALRWTTQTAAEEWLQICRMAWLWGKAPKPENAGPRIVEETMYEGWEPKTIRRYV